MRHKRYRPPQDNPSLIHQLKDLAIVLISELVFGIIIVMMLAAVGAAALYFFF